jgi:phage major head subunit gpT-like protein
MPMSTGQFSNLLIPGWVKKTWRANMNDYDPLYTDIVTVIKSNQAFEQYQETIEFGLVGVKNPGQPTTLQTAYQGWFNQIVNVSWGLGFSVTRELKDDEKYGFINKLPKGLSRSMNQTLEILAANMLNNAFDSTGFPIYDGVSLLNTAHPTALGGTFSNTFATVQYDLSETALSLAESQILQYKDPQGLTIRLMPERLHVPPALKQRAHKLLFSTLEPESGNNAVNYITQSKMFSKGLSVNPYLTSASAWFVTTDQEGLILQEHTEPEISSDHDFLSKADIVTVYSRFNVGVTDPRSVFGSQGVALT